MIKYWWEELTDEQLADEEFLQYYSWAFNNNAKKILDKKQIDFLWELYLKRKKKGTLEYPKSSFKEYEKRTYAKVENKHPNLVIHMDDRSTDFLKAIYANIPCDVVRSDPDPIELKKAIESHERVLMMGHGSPGGLFGKRYGVVIGFDMVPELSKKDNSIFIWCHADEFVERHHLKGFYTGMFVSEVSEARWNQIEPLPTQQQVDFSNNLYAKIVGSVINGSKEEIYTAVKKKYNPEMYIMNKVIAYNAKRQYKA